MKKHFIFLTLLASVGCGPNIHNNPQLLTSDSSSIVGGQVVDQEGFAKHVVAIHNADLGYWCTGTLISKNTILTAAHCIDEATESSYTIHFSKSPRTFETITRNVSSMKANSGYNAVAYDDRKDIGVIRFEGEAPEGFVPMALPTSRDLSRMSNRFYAAGYGTITARSDIPRGSGVLRYTTQTVKGNRISTAQTQFIVDQTNGHGICYGDSGGPAFAEIDDHEVVFGVASAVYSTNTEAKKRKDFDVCRYNAIYTSVFYYLDWIKKASASLR
jgi:secreted trypsin-like serine protease